MKPADTENLKRNLAVPQKALQEFCVRNHITKLAFFGSVPRSDFGPDSDVDALVQFEPNHIPSLFRIVELEEELSKLLGRKADMRTPDDLSRYFRDEVVNAAAVAYAA